MIGWLRRIFHHGEYRKEEADALLHGLRNQTQVAQLQTHIYRSRERKRQDLADAIARSRPPFHIGEEGHR